MFSSNEDDVVCVPDEKGYGVLAIWGNLFVLRMVY